MGFVEFVEFIEFVELIKAEMPRDTIETGGDSWRQVQCVEFIGSVGLKGLRPFFRGQPLTRFPRAPFPFPLRTPYHLVQCHLVKAIDTTFASDRITITMHVVDG